MRGFFLFLVSFFFGWFCSGSASGLCGWFFQVRFLDGFGIGWDCFSVDVVFSVTAGFLGGFVVLPVMVVWKRSGALQINVCVLLVGVLGRSLCFSGRFHLLILVCMFSVL